MFEKYAKYMLCNFLLSYLKYIYEMERIGNFVASFMYQNIFQNVAYFRGKKIHFYSGRPYV